MSKSNHNNLNNSMPKLLKPLIFSCAIVVATAWSSLAQLTAPPVPDTSATTANTTQTGQAPADLLKKLHDLLHAGKYVEAQQLVAGLLVAYPDDQRLVKAKALLDRLLAPAGSANAASASNQPTMTAPPAQPASNTTDEELTGMDKVDYNALIRLARQAQQTTDLPQQKALLHQFMDQSRPFLEKHPAEIQIWELRVASAITLDDLMAGYEAGQKLLAMGAADSTDPNLQSLLAQLKNQGWLAEEGAEKVKKRVAETQEYAWILGHWSLSSVVPAGCSLLCRDSVSPAGSVDFSLSDSSDSVVEGYVTNTFGVRDIDPTLTVTILNSGKISCEYKQQPWGCGFSNHNKFLVIYGITNDSNWELTAHSYAPVSSQAAQPPAPAPASVLAPQPAGFVVQNSVSVNTSAPTPPATAAAPASASTTSETSPVAAPASGTAILHVYRVKHVFDGNAKFEVSVDGSKVTQLASGQTSKMGLAAGSHAIIVTVKLGKKKPATNLETEAGKEYWLRIELVNSFPTGYVVLTEVSAEQAKAESEKLEELKLGDLGSQAPEPRIAFDGQPVPKRQE